MYLKKKLILTIQSLLLMSSAHAEVDETYPAPIHSGAPSTQPQLNPRTYSAKQLSFSLNQFLSEFALSHPQTAENLRLLLLQTDVSQQAAWRSNKWFSPFAHKLSAWEQTMPNSSSQHIMHQLDLILYLLRHPTLELDTPTFEYYPQTIRSFLFEKFNQAWEISTSLNMREIQCGDPNKWNNLLLGFFIQATRMVDHTEWSDNTLTSMTHNLQNFQIKLIHALLFDTDQPHRTYHAWKWQHKIVTFINTNINSIPEEYQRMWTVIQSWYLHFFVQEDQHSPTGLVISKPNLSSTSNIFQSIMDDIEAPDKIFQSNFNFVKKYESYDEELNHDEVDFEYEAKRLTRTNLERRLKAIGKNAIHCTDIDCVIENYGPDSQMAIQYQKIQNLIQALNGSSLLHVKQKEYIDSFKKNQQQQYALYSDIIEEMEDYNQFTLQLQNELHSAKLQYEKIEESINIISSIAGHISKLLSVTYNPYNALEYFFDSGNVITKSALKIEKLELEFNSSIKLTKREQENKLRLQKVSIKQTLLKDALEIKKLLNQQFALEQKILAQHLNIKKSTKDMRKIASDALMLKESAEELHSIIEKRFHNMVNATDKRYLMQIFLFEKINDMLQELEHAKVAMAFTWQDPTIKTGRVNTVLSSSSILPISEQIQAYWIKLKHVYQDQERQQRQQFHTSSIISLKDYFAHLYPNQSFQTVLQHAQQPNIPGDYAFQFSTLPHTPQMKNMLRAPLKINEAQCLYSQGHVFKRIDQIAIALDTNRPIPTTSMINGKLSYGGKQMFWLPRGESIVAQWIEPLFKLQDKYKNQLIFPLQINHDLNILDTSYSNTLKGLSVAASNWILTLQLEPSWINEGSIEDIQITIRHSHYNYLSHCE